jgi:hypothetical protein
MRDITYPHWEENQDYSTYYLSGNGRASEEERTSYGDELISSNQ